MSDSICLNCYCSFKTETIIMNRFSTVFMMIFMSHISYAGEITVNKLTMVVADDGFCTLTEAITAANNNNPSGLMNGECVAGSLGHDEIRFDALTAVGGLMMNDVQFPPILEALSIIGPGVDELVIDAQQFGFIFGVRADFELTGVSLLNGEGLTGASIYQFTAHDLTLRDCRISGSSVSDKGGAIRVLGAEQANTIIIEGCEFINNDAVNDGGAIYAGVVSGRRMNLNMTDVQFIDNDSRSGSGGAMALSTNGTGVINFDFENIFFQENRADINGGAMFADGEGIKGMIQGSSFTKNIAQIVGGAVIWLNTSTIYSVNNTFYDNSAGSSAGAVFAQAQSGMGAEILLVNNTLARNSVTGQGTGNGGGLFGQGASVKIKNTVIAENSVINGGVDCAGTVTSLGHNLIGDGTACGLLDDASDLVGESGNTLNPLFSFIVSPVDGAYAIPSINSLLINAGDPDSCDAGLPFTILFDQLGRSRYQDPLDDNQFFGRCDIGAIEVQSPDLIFKFGFESSLGL